MIDIRKHRSGWVPSWSRSENSQLSHHACWADTKFQVFDLSVTEFQSVNKVVFHDELDCAFGNVTEYDMEHLQRVQISI